jgi:hypothetical protein
MPAVFDEAWDSGSGQMDAVGQGSGVTLTFHVLQTDDEEEAHDCVQANLPAFFRHWPYRSYRLTFQGGDVWRGEADFGYGSTGATRVTFTTRGGTRHITQSFVQHSYSPTEEEAPDYQNAINVNGDSVEGVDVVSPVLHFTEEHWLPYTSVVQPTYMNNLVGLTGTVNNDVFRGFQAGEVLFHGADGAYEVSIVAEPDPDLKVPVTYEFSASPNLADLAVGDITGVAKQGHDFLWVRYKEDTSDDEKHLVKVPAFVYVEKVYEDGNFDDLGIEDPFSP